MLATHSISSPIARYTNWWISLSSRRQASTSACAPVTISICDSLKSVVMFGLASAEPSASGCGVRASVPLGSTRRLSFSMPRRIPFRRSAGSARRRSCKLVKPALPEIRGVDGSRGR